MPFENSFVLLRDVNPVCYRHRLPAISGSLFKVLAAGLGGAYSGIWPASNWHRRYDNNDDDEDDDDDDVNVAVLRAVSQLLYHNGPTTIVKSAEGDEREC